LVFITGGGFERRGHLLTTTGRKEGPRKSHYKGLTEKKPQCLGQEGL